MLAGIHREDGTRYESINTIIELVVSKEEPMLIQNKSHQMKRLGMELLPLVACTLALCLSSSQKACAQQYETRNITENILTILDSEDGEDQLVVESEKGLVVFNTFWSETTARRFRKEIAKALNRDDFAYTINTADRLDVFGGNAAYGETIIIGHNTFLEKYQGKEEDVEAEINRLVEMWRWKEGISRERLETHEQGSETWIDEQRWMNTCNRRADELEQGFSLVLPTILYDDRITLNLGDITLKLIWFGKAGHYNGMTVAVIPEEKIAIISNFILHPQHLAPHPHNEYKDLDVPRWIAVMEEILEGENAVERVICGMNDVWSRERAHTHLEYIRKLWNAVTAAEAAGKSLDEIQDQLSLERDFAFVKEMQTYKDGGDDWTRPQHFTHVRLFFLQHKNLASETIMGGGLNSLQVSLAKVKELRDNGSDIYFDEASINGIGYYLMGLGKYAEAIQVLELNVDVFPRSFNVYDSLGEAYMKNGDHQDAIDNYKRSLELNPENNNAREMLERLQKG